MAKNGFIISNRRAVEEITASTTLTAEDCGKVIVLNDSSAITLTLSSAASLGAGWNCVIKIGTNQANHVIGSADQKYVVGMTGEVTAAADLAGGNCVQVDMVGANLVDGDTFELVTDGTDIYIKPLVTNYNAYTVS
jgi:hypothetical protein